MKTSTILLIITASIFVVVPIFHTAKLNGMIERGEYTLYSQTPREPGEMITIQPFKHIQFNSANNVSILIAQSDTTSLEKEESLDIKVTQRGDTLFIEQSKEKLDFHQPSRFIHINTPDLSKADITGILWSDTIGTGTNREVQTSHFPFEVRIRGFAGERLELACRDGGHLLLNENDFRNSQFRIGLGSVLNIARDNRLDSLSLTTGKGGHIDLQGAAVEHLKSSIHPESSLTVSGMEIK